ncbi:hypothetical protein F4559_004257 [Saccharothrix violaceirubra]|uniref:Uncharacterized protein n=1 Tax=Saccharothrix violaceirubra TaxID=413306 RepID=A0A7W7T5D4_9PSEU|nr:hypothetical protein [Saccharothrix violaceirubra]
MQFFASEAVGVGNSRSWSGSDGPPCLLAALMPFDEPSCAVGVGSISASSVGAGLAQPGEQEHPLAAVRGADVGGADATPERVIPRFGQVAEYTVESSVAPAKRGDVLHHDERGS